MKVWLVWQGFCSDQEVIAVAETEKIANKLKEVYSNDRWKETYITSVEMATKDTVRFEKAFKVIYSCSLCKSSVEEVRSIESVDEWYTFDEIYDYGDLEVWVKADTVDEAVEKANLLIADYRKHTK